MTHDARLVEQCAPRNAGRLLALLMASAAIVLAAVAEACPICEAGSKDAATFIFVVFGLFVAGMGVAGYLFWRAGAFRGGTGVEYASMRAEGISVPGEPKQAVEGNKA